MIHIPVHTISPTNIIPTLHPTLLWTQSEFSEIHSNSLFNRTIRSTIQCTQDGINHYPKHSSISHSHPLLSKTTKWIDKTVIQHIEIASALSYSTQSEMREWAYHYSLNAYRPCFRSIYHLKWRLNGLEDGNRVLWDRYSFKLQVCTFRVMRMSTTTNTDNCQTIACGIICCYFKCYLSIWTTCIPENQVSSETACSQIDLFTFIIEFIYNRLANQIQTINNIPSPNPIVISIPTT